MSGPAPPLSWRALRARFVPWTTTTRALILACSATLLALPLTVPSGVMAALIGALVGAVGADLLDREGGRGARVRTSAAIGVSGAIALIAIASADLAVDTTPLPALLGAVGVVALSEVLRWFFLCAASAFALRLLAARTSVGGVIEVAAVAGAFVTALAAHRHGAVHRPLAFGDWAWRQGIDPTYVLLFLGGFSVLLAALMMIRETSARRLPLHLSALAVVALLLLLLVRFEGLPHPDPPGAGQGAEEPTKGDDGDAQQSAGGQGRKDSKPSDDWNFRDEFNEEQNQAPVAVVVLHDDYEPPAGAFYFRQSALSQYNGNRLVQPTRDDVDRDIIRYFPATPLELPAPPGEADVRAPLSTTIGLLVDHVRPFALDSPQLLAPTPMDGSLRFQRAYEVRSAVPVLRYEDLFSRRPGAPDWDASQWEHYTEAPEDPRYTELAREILQDIAEEHRDDPLARALAVKLRLDETGTYSLASKHAGSDDPTASFLFGDRTGYCIHFSHAAAYLLRALDVPTRVATGYMVNAADRYGGSALLLRALDAHAWPEIYLEDVGWVVVDLSPEKVEGDVAAPPDAELQRMLGQMLRQQKEGETLPQEDFAQGPELAEILRFVRNLLLAAIVAGFLVKLYRALVPVFARPDAVPRVGYRAALDRLVEVGVRRRFGESRERFAQRAARVSPTFGRLTFAHLEGTLGAPDHLPEADAMRAMMRAVGAEIRDQTPAWRRLLGSLDPFSWWRVR